MIKEHRKYFIASKKVGFRHYHKDYSQLITNWINDPEINQFFPQPLPHTAKKMDRCTDRLDLSDNEVGFIAFDVTTDEPIGIVEVRSTDFKTKKCELELALGNKKFFGKGYGVAMMQLIHEYVFTELGLHKAMIHVMATNAPMKKLALKMGYRVEGVLRDEWFKGGEYHDVLSMAYIRDRCAKKPLAHIPENVLGLIGNTPVVEFQKINPYPHIRIFGKLEFFNPSGGVKDRAAQEMIEDAEKRGIVNKDTVIVECTSGNTGIGLATICAIKGMKCILVAPEGVIPLGKKSIIEALGAELLQTPIEGDYELSIEVSEKIAAKLENAFVPHQFDNFANPQVHKKTTVVEIMRDFGADLDAVVCSVGSGGTITGVGEVLKEMYPHIEMVAVEPENCAALSHGNIGEHFILGIGAGFIPKIMNEDIVDDVQTVTDEEAAEYCLKLAREEGIFCGISSGAAMAGALKYAAKQKKPKNILVFIPDNGVRYVGKKGFFMDYFYDYVDKHKKIGIPKYD